MSARARPTTHAGVMPPEVVDSLWAESNDGIVTKDAKGIITGWNPGAERLYGYSADECIGRPMSMLIPESLHAEEQGLLAKVMRGERIQHYETERLRKNGDRIVVSLTLSPITDADGVIVGAAGNARDVTDRIRADTMEREASKYARSLIEASLDPLVTINTEGKITDVNAATERVTGLNRDSLVGTDFSNYFTEPEKASEGYSRVFQEGSVTDYPLAIRHKDGDIIDVLYNASVYKDDEGNVAGVFAAARDITRQRKAESQMRIASAYARSLIEASLDPLVTISPEGKITDVNEATELVTGINRQTLIGTDFADYFTEPDKAREGYQLAFSQGKVTDYPLAIQAPDGSITDVLYNASVYQDEAGNIQGVFAAARDVTGRKRAEALQQSSSEYARSLIEASLDPLVTISAEGKITDVNEATEHITGLSRDQLIGRDFSDYFTDPNKAREGYQLVFDQGQVRDYALAIRHASGKVIEVLYNASVYKDRDGNVLGVFAAARDVTEQQRIQNELATLSSYARSLIEASLDPLVTISPEGKITDVNDATEKATGVKRDQLIGTDFADYFTQPEKAREGYQLVFKQGQVKDYPLAIRHSDGHITDVLYNASVYRDESGEVQGVFAAARDVTKQRNVEVEMQRASAYARSLIEASLDPLVTISPEGKITDVNQATEAVTGRPRQTLIGTDFSKYFTEPEKAREGYQLVFEQGQVKDYPLAIRHKDGNITNVLYNASVYKDNRGDVIGVFAAARDVSEIKRAERLQKSASAYARSLIEASLDPLVTISPEGKITDVNQATEQVTGRNRSELVGTDFADYFTNPQKAREGYQLVFEEGQVKDYPLAIRHTDGHVTDVLYNASVYRDADTNVKGVFAAARDITQRKASEQSLEQTAVTLRRSNRELEQFAYAASHDLQAPLRAVRSYLDFLREALGDTLDDDTTHYLDRSMAGVERMRHLIEDLLQFSRVERRGSPFASFVATDALAAAIENLDESIHRHDAKVRFDDNLPKLRADKTQITALFQNLIGNALRYHGDDPPEVHISCSEEANSYLFTVADNGKGIAPEHHERIFGVFQRLSNSDDSEGTGIGLALCRRIAERHGGRIWVESELGAGARFHIRIARNPSEELPGDDE